MNPHPFRTTNLSSTPKGTFFGKGFALWEKLEREGKIEKYPTHEETAKECLV